MRLPTTAKAAAWMLLTSARGIHAAAQQEIVLARQGHCDNATGLRLYHELPQIAAGVRYLDDLLRQLHHREQSEQWAAERKAKEAAEHARLQAEKERVAAAFERSENYKQMVVSIATAHLKGKP